MTIFGDIEEFIIHPIDTTENVFKKASRFVSHPVDTTENFFKDETKTIQNTIQHPINAITGDFSEVINEIERIPTTLEKGFDNFEAFGTEVKKDIGVVADDLTSAGRWVWSEAQAIEKGAEGGLRVVRNTFIFVENYYKLILMAGGLYMGSKLYNEVKKTELII